MRNCVPCRCRGREVEKESPRDIMNSDFVPRGDPLLTISIIYARFFPHVGGHTHSGYRTNIGGIGYVISFSAVMIGVAFDGL